MIAWIKGHTSSVVIGILIVCCFFLLYSWIDARITIDHAWRTVDSRKNDALVLRELLQVIGKHTPRKEITLLINKQFNKEHVVKEEPGQISVDGIILKFDGDRLAKVLFMNEE